MTNRYVITMNLGGEAVHEESRLSLMAAAERWGADYVELTEPWGKAQGDDIMGAKLELDLVPVEKGARVAYIDGDCLVSEACPDPFEAVPRGMFGAVRNFQGDTHGGDPYPSHQPWWDKLAPKFECTLQYHPSLYYNGGVLIYEPAVHGDVWQTARWRTKHPREGVKTNPMIEQTAVSLSLLFHKVAMVPLATSWNRLGPHVWQHEGQLDVWIAHFANIAPFRGLKYKHEAIERCEWRASA